MAFRWFRQNDKVTRWIYIGVTVFVMATFSITGAMYEGLRNDDSKVVAGSFRLPDGEVVEVTRSDFSDHMRRYARMIGNTSEQQVWQLIMLNALAEDAGIVVSNEMLKRFLVGQGLRSQADLDRFLEARGLSRNEFNEIQREELRRMLYQQLSADATRVLSKEVFERFQEDNEKFQLEYVAWRDADERAALDAEVPSDEELEAWYDTGMDAATKSRDFSAEERFKLEALVLDLEGRAADDLRALLPEAKREVTDAQLQSTYQRVKDYRFKTTEDAAGDGSPGDGSDGEGAGDDGAGDGSEADGAGDAAESADPYRPLDEVKDEVERLELASRVLAEARLDFNTRVGQQRTLQAQKDAQGDEVPEGEEPIEVPTMQSIVDAVAEKFSLRQVDFPDAVSVEGVKDLPEIGAEDLGSILRFLRTGEIRMRDVQRFVEVPYLVVVEEKFEREPKPFAEVKDELLDPWRDATAKERADEKADAFLAALQAAARPKVEAEVAKIEAEAADAAAKTIEAQGLTDEAAQQEVRDQALADRQAEIDALLEPHYGEVFDAVVAGQGATVETTDWFRKSAMNTEFYRDREASVEKFLMGRDLETGEGRFDHEVGAVFGPLRDDDSGASVVARVKARELPGLGEMGLYDRQMAEGAVARDKDPEAMAAMMARFQGQPFEPSRFSYQTLALKLGLQIAEREDAAPAE